MNFSEAQTLLYAMAEVSKSFSFELRSKLLYWAGRYASRGRDYTRAVELFKELEVLSREAGNKLYLGNTLIELGRMESFHFNNLAAGLAKAEEGLALTRETGNKVFLASALISIGVLHYRFQNDTRLMEEALALAREVEYTPSILIALSNLANYFTTKEDYQTAEEYAKEVLEIVKVHRGLFYPVSPLNTLGDIARKQGQPDRAARLWGAADALQEIAFPDFTQPYLDQQSRVRAAARAEMGETAFTRSWEAGRAMSLGQAIEYALEEGKSFLNFAFPAL